ncbi:MAG: IS630 family transposase [Planctomycetes bacterium]|nr:IS630 family transposase [Planctomycetota bacterium]
MLRKFGAKARSEPTSVELEDYREVIELCDQMQQEWPEGWPAVRALKRKNSEEFLLFLRHLLEDKPPDTTYILVLDNAGYHRANKVMDFFKQHRGDIEPFWLPPYSPELNLIEYVWGYLKEKVTNNYYFGEMDHLLRALKKARRKLAAPESKILSVDFKTHNYLPEAA